MARLFKAQCLAVCLFLGFTAYARAEDRRVFMLELAFIENCVFTRGDPGEVSALVTKEGLQAVTDPKAKAFYAGNEGGSAWTLNLAGADAVLSLQRPGVCMVFASGLDPVEAAARFEQLVTSPAKGNLRVTQYLDHEQKSSFGNEITKAWIIKRTDLPAVQQTFEMITYSRAGGPFQVNWQFMLHQPDNQN